MAKYSIQTLLWSLSYTIRDRMGMVIVGITMATSAATYYSIPILIMQAINSLAQAFAGVTKPAASSLYAQKKLKNINALVFRGNRMAASFLIPIIYFLVIYGKQLIVIWIGKDNFAPMGSVLTILLLGELPILIQLVSAFVLIGIGKQKYFAIFTLGVATASTILMLFFTNFTDYGLRGIALATAIPAFLNGTLFIPIITCRVLHCRPLQYIVNTFVRPVGATSFFGILLYTAHKKIPPQSIWEMGLLLLCTLPVLFLGLYYLALTHEERLQLSSPWRTIRSKLNQVSPPENEG